MMSDKAASSLLVIVLDTNPVWWGENLNVAQSSSKLSLSQCVDAVMVFANAHLMLGHHNQLAVIAAHTNQSEFLYPREEAAAAVETGDGDAEMEQYRQVDGKYELFGRVNAQIQAQIQQLVLQGLEGELYSDSLIAGPLSMALCYIHRMEKESGSGLVLTSRILVIKGSEDNPTQYMNFMNAVFTAQKQNVVVDACILDNESGLLQQACDITGGIYLKVPQMLGLLQYLLWVFLPDPLVRDKLTLPPKDQVDYRAACFCHRNLIDVGYVCSVCLSIFCNFSPICSTCQTTFKFLGPPKLLKKKSKKTS
ncbi:general transcription factor IIH subunit 3-like [Haliotis rufescens]|uniref:general transcription factor IIH subunit 3-like n=1 Tax=Haliotis rufescens TaxID=6454 RepID=UPI001EB0AD42|nr:general transcription factor IIH subunit 3-like [Haliotis rufescens]